MSVKWKIFYALNVILGLPAFTGFLLIVLNFSAGGKSTMAYWISGIGLLVLFLMSINSLLNIFLLHRFYPDKLIPTSIRTTTRVLFILLSIISLGLLVLCIGTAIETFDNSKRDINDRSGKNMLIIFSVMTLVQIIILIIQRRLPSLIKRNHQNSLHSLIESIGQEPQ